MSMGHSIRLSDDLHITDEMRLAIKEYYSWTIGEPSSFKWYTAEDWKRKMDTNQTYFEKYLSDRLLEDDVRAGYEHAQEMADLEDMLAAHGRRHLKKVLISMAVVSGIALLIHIFRKD